MLAPAESVQKGHFKTIYNAEAFMKIYSFSPFGYEGSLVSVEVDLRRGIPAIDMVGLADGAVKESRERMRSAIRNSGFDFPPERVLISLSPADVKKEGAGFDLAVALAVLAEKDSIEGNGGNLTASPILVMGELELNGRIRPVRGIHAAASTAHAEGIRLCIVPAANGDEAREIDGMKVFGAEDLSGAYCALTNTTANCFTTKIRTKESVSDCPECGQIIEGIAFSSIETGMEYAEVKDQTRFVRALQIAAAGGHNLLAYGPPGCGKTLGIQKFPALLPLLTHEEAQPVTRIYSIAGLLSPNHPAMRRAPFRQPHQTASIEGMCGGGVHCTPGEISLAHNGVLFLDEAAEFKTSVLQMLRVPLESGTVTLSRAGRSTVFPASFQLLMATNPCPCGNFGSAEKICLCSARSIEQYWRKFSAPLLDRIDIRLQVEREKDGERPQSTEQLRQAIAKAVFSQRQRQGKRNAKLTAEEIGRYCKCTSGAQLVLDTAEHQFSLSPRGIAGCLKLARTIADMTGKEIIDDMCMSEAVSYRKAADGMEAPAGIL